MKKNKDVFNTVITAAFVLLAFILMVLLSAGINLEFSRLQEWSYWINIFIRLAVMMILYNALFTFDLQQKKRDVNSAFFFASATKQMRVNRIKRENMFDALGKAVEIENKVRYDNLCTKVLNKACLRLTIADLPAERGDIDKWLADVKERFYLDEKSVQKVRKAALKILNGKVRYHELTADDILDMLGEDNIDNTAITFSSTSVIRRQNAIKAGMFLLGVIAMTVFSYSPRWADFVFDIIVNSTLLVGATYSAILNSRAYLKRKTMVFENQNTFLASRMGLTDEYSARHLQPSKEVVK